MRAVGQIFFVVLLVSLFTVGCTSTTAPPIVPAPDAEKPKKNEAEKAVAIAETPKTETAAADVKKPENDATAKTPESTTPPAIADSGSANTETQKTETAKDETSTTDENTDASKTATPPVATQAETKPEVGAAADTKLAAGPSRADIMRLIAFAPAGPLVIDVAVYLDGQPLGKVRTAAIDRIYNLIDDDHDGRISWEQFVKNPRVKSGLYGNAAIADGAKLDDLLEKYDVVKNGRVDKEELPRFFSDDRGATKAFSLLAPARPVGSPGEDSMILAWLDADGDGQLSAEERAEARAQLRIRDSDDDRVLSSSELMPQMDSRMAGMSSMRKPSNGPPSGILLGPNPRWESLSYYLEEIYAGVGKKLRTSHFPGTEELAKRVDGNKDGRISSIELQNLENVPADLVLTLRFLSKQEKDNPGPTMEASPLAGDWAKYQPEWKQEGLRSQFTADEYSISFSMSDLVGMASGVEFAKPIFEQADADKNGYLEEKEFSMPQLTDGMTFAQVDENSDGKVYMEEIEKLASERQVVAGTQAVIKVEVTGDPFLGVLDRDGDGRLSDREIREAEKNLSALDKDGDGLVGIGELPQSMKISVIRGIVADGTIIPDYPSMAAATPKATEAPLWFTKMDTNGDSELNEIEFIGTTEQFAALDKDHDGAIATAELPPQPKVEPKAEVTKPAEAAVPEKEKTSESNPAEGPISSADNTGS